LCQAITKENISVGDLVKEADLLRRGCTRNEAKLMQAMKKYNVAWNILKNSNESHAECVKCVDEEYRAVFKSIQGSRA